MRALTVNTGSTSVKLALWEDARRTKAVRWDLPVDADPMLREWVGGAPEAIAHRVVHGGARSAAVAIDADVLDEVRGAIPLAPNHNPQAVAWIEACTRVWPRARQVAAFDTAFFAHLPAVARTYALPRELARKHALRRYGFHGLAHASMWAAWCGNTKDKARARIVTLQLGGGCSAAAIDGGAPLETSMGLTPLEGLVMATRAGDVDAGLLMHLARVERLDPDALEELLAKRSGLLGISGLSGDLRELAEAPDDPNVRLAIDVFVHRVRKYIGAYAAVLGGLDGVVMGGGVSEHWPDVRARILEGFEWLGLEMDDTKNRAVRAVTAPIHTQGSRVEVWVATIDEERELLGAL